MKNLTLNPTNKIVLNRDVTNAEVFRSHSPRSAWIETYNWSAFIGKRLLKQVGFIYNYTMSSVIGTDIAKIRNFVALDKFFPDFIHNIDYTLSYHNLQGQQYGRIY